MEEVREENPGVMDCVKTSNLLTNRFLLLSTGVLKIVCLTSILGVFLLFFVFSESWLLPKNSISDGAEPDYPQKHRHIVF